MSEGRIATTAAPETRQSSFWRDAWPGGVGGLLMMPIGLVLKRWLPPHFAMGVGAFAVWFLVNLIYARRSPPRFGLPVWAAASLTGIASGLCVGLLYYYFPF